MRLLIKLKCIEDGQYEMQYHYHLQGFIYNLLKGSKYHYIHDKVGYKFFCFSNIFPVNPLITGGYRNLIISSPNEDFILYLYEQLLHLVNSHIKIGQMKFIINTVDKFYVKLPIDFTFTLITGTPITIRIPREKYKVYGINPKSNYEYVYWRSDHPIDLFISYLQYNLTKKYNEYFGLNSGNSIAEYSEDYKEFSFFLFQNLKFKKQISTILKIKGFNQVIIGTIWEFRFNINVNRDIIQFAVESGLGERNSLGFGFINIIQNNSHQYD